VRSELQSTGVIVIAITRLRVHLAKVRPLRTQTEQAFPRASSPTRIRSLLVLAAWFGIIAGLVEGVGLLLFQRINWERWGPTLHVSEQIVWISAVANLLLFSLSVLLLSALPRLFPKTSIIRSAARLLVALTIFDWLMVTARLSALSCFLLAVGVAVAGSRSMAKHEAGFLQLVQRTFPMVAAAAVLSVIGIQGGIGCRKTERLRPSRLQRLTHRMSWLSWWIRFVPTTCRRTDILAQRVRISTMLRLRGFYLRMPYPVLPGPSLRTRRFSLAVIRSSTGWRRSDPCQFSATLTLSAWVASPRLGRL